MAKLDWTKAGDIRPDPAKYVRPRSWDERFGWLRLVCQYRDSHCRSCRKTIPLGSLMRWKDGHGAMHQRCYEASDEVT